MTTWRVVVVGLGALASACGGGGKGDDDPTVNPIVVGIVQGDVHDVTGSFALSDAAHPASGWFIYLLDHTAPSYQFLQLDDDGAFKLPVKSFVESHIYSFHLVHDFQVVADVDFSALLPDVQAAIRYEGGDGFAVGGIIIPRDAHGDYDGSQVVGAIGGGFSVEPTLLGTFSAYPIPPHTTLFDFGSQLYVMETQTLLESFYRRAAHPALYAHDLGELSRVALRVVGETATSYSDARVVQGGPWLGGAKLATADDGSPRDATAWAATDFELTATDPGTLEASAFAGGVPSVGTLLELKATPAQGNEVFLPKVIGTIVAEPPKVVAAAANGQAAVAVDYEAASGENGLTRPFCQTGDVTLTLQPPRDLGGNAIPATRLKIVDAAMDYYTRVAGQSSLIAATGAMMPDDYKVTITTQTGDWTRTWDPAKLRFRYALADTAAAADTQSIVLPKEAFPFKLGADDVFLVRVRLYYRSVTEVTEAASVAWFDLVCQP